MSQQPNHLPPGDVLTSIRRLLAEEAAARLPAEGPLLLTPAQRVPEEDGLDEERLRRIVREVIREELQGAMGERITRNIRKLLRAEIRRALLADDPE